MEKRMRSSSRPQLEDIPEMIHHIQRRLSPKEAARTSVLSKAWLHAWSTIPVLRFTQAGWSFTEEQEREHLKVVDRTLKRYVHDHIPFRSIYLKINIENQDSAILADDWIRLVANKNCLKRLSLKILVTNVSFTLPDEILSGKNLITLAIYSLSSKIHSLFMTSHPVINCVSLKELDLQNIHISEEVLDVIFSTCSLLAKITIIFCKGFKTIKVKNLCCLYELEITSQVNATVLEISHVPKLRLLRFHTLFPTNPLPFNAHSISVTQLSLSGVIVDDALLDMIGSKFPILKILTLDMRYWNLGSFNFTCNSIKRLSLKSCQESLIDVHVKAPELRFFCFRGKGMPTLSFPAAAISPLLQLKLNLWLYQQVDASYFLKMRKAFELSIKCDIEITMFSIVIRPLLVINDIDIDDLRTRVPFPAINVNELSFRTDGDEGLEESSPFFDLFFSICHPKHVVAYRDTQFEGNNHFSKLMVREVMMETKNSKGYWRDYLKDVEIRRHHDEKWETLTSSWKNVLDESASYYVRFKLNWLQHNKNPVISD